MAAWVVMDRVACWLANGRTKVKRQPWSLGEGEGGEGWTRGALVTRREPLGDGLLQWILTGPCTPMAVEVPASPFARAASLLLPLPTYVHTSCRGLRARELEVPAGLLSTTACFPSGAPIPGRLPAGYHDGINGYVASSACRYTSRYLWKYGSRLSPTCIY